MGLYPLYGKTENVCGDLTHHITSRTAPAYKQLVNLQSGASLHIVQGMMQLKADALDNGAVQVDTGVVIGKSDHRSP